MAYIVRPTGDTDLANATIHAETDLPQTISGTGRIGEMQTGA